MEFDNLLTLVKNVSESNLTELEYEEKGVRILLSKRMEQRAEKAVSQGAASVETAAGNLLVNLPSCDSAAMAESVSAAESQTASKMDTQPEGNIVKSPLVGVFYAAPAEDAAPFVAVGDKVEKNQTLAIVEAMKLMNEIESEYAGTVAEIYVENGQAVEYGQPLFRIV